MTNILVEGYCHIPSYDLTVKDLERFQKVLPINVRSKLSRNINSSDILWADIVFCVRPNNPLSCYIAVKARAAGREVIVSLDDDLLEYKSSGFTWVDTIGKKSLVRALKLSSTMITTSRYLADKYKKKFGIGIILSDTVVENNEIRKPIPSEKKLKIVYAAASSHRVFFEKLISPILNDLYIKYNDKVSLTLIGPQIDTSSLMMKVNFIASMPMDAYQEFMSSHHFDIGLAPLLDEEFCRSKYFNKYLEYTKNNIFGIYSNVLPYKNVIKDEVNGLLVEGSPEKWLEYLSRAIDNPEFRSECVKNAQNDVLKNFSLEGVANRIVKQYPSLITFKAPQKSRIFVGPLYLYFLVFELFIRLMSRLALILK